MLLTFDFININFVCLKIVCSNDKLKMCDDNLSAYNSRLSHDLSSRMAPTGPLMSLAASHGLTPPTSLMGHHHGISSALHHHLQQQHHNHHTTPSSHLTPPSTGSSSGSSTGLMSPQSMMGGGMKPGQKKDSPGGLGVLGGPNAGNDDHIKRPMNAFMVFIYILLDYFRLRLHHLILLQQFDAYH